MANRRMFSLDVVDTDRFLDMSASAQALYFHLGMRADDDGFVSSPRKIAKASNCGLDDLTLLAAKGFIIPFESGVVVVTHWKENNYIRADRYKPTRYTKEAEMLEKIGDVYQLSTTGIPTDNQMVDTWDTQDRLGGVSEEELMDIRESANKANVSSLDSVVSQDNDKIVLRDLIASDQNLEEDAIKKRDREMMQEELNYIIDNLPDEQRRVIQEHYFERRTMKQIGERMGCSGAKAGDIERKALRKLRLPHVNRKYKEYHEQCLTPYPIMHIGIDSFQRTGYSEVERAVLGW